MFHEYRRPFIGPKLVFLEQGVFLERCYYVPCRNVDENENEVAMKMKTRLPKISFFSLMKAAMIGLK